MAVVEQLQAAGASAPTHTDLVSEEVQEYQLFTHSLRAMRALFAGNQLSDVDQACETILLLADSLERKAADRHCRQPGPSPEDRTDLREAQLEARIELMATLQVLADLQMHTRTLISTLRGNTPVTYQAPSRRRALGGRP